MSEERYKTGLRIRKEVLGEEYVERALSSADDFNSDFQRIVTEYAWGGAWGRDGLDKRQRSLLNLAMLSALNRPEEFKIHLRGALTNGCSLGEIRETLIQVSIYCGIPAGVEAFRLARQVFADDGIDVSGC